MPVFQGYPVAVGDTLEEINEGRVTVMQLYSSSMMVNIPGKGSRHYSYAGVVAGGSRPSLFWHDIRIVLPPKDPALWAAQRELLKGVSEAVGPMAARIREDGEPFEEFIQGSGS